MKAALGETPDAAAFADVYGISGKPSAEGERYVLASPIPLPNEPRCFSYLRRLERDWRRCGSGC